MIPNRDSIIEGQASMLLIQAWRDPANSDIRDAFLGDIVIFDHYLRAAAAGRANVVIKGHDPLKARLDPIVADMRKILFN